MKPLLAVSQFWFIAGIHCHSYSKCEWLYFILEWSAQVFRWYKCLGKIPQYFFNHILLDISYILTLIKIKIRVVIIKCMYKVIVNFLMCIIIILIYQVIFYHVLIKNCNFFISLLQDGERRMCVRHADGSLPPSN